MHVIAWHRTWLAAKKFGEIGEAVMFKPGIGIVRFKCRVLVFEVRIPRECFRKFQTVSVPEFAIEESIRKLSHNPAFKKRLMARGLTFQDINEIIRVASEDTISLELEE